MRIRRGCGPPQPGETGKPPAMGRRFSGYLGAAALGTALVVTFSFAGKVIAARERPVAVGTVLEVTSLSLSRAGGLAVVEGRVTNLSSEPLDYIWVRALFEDADGKLVSRSDDTLIESAKLLPGGTAAFRVYGVWNPAIVKCAVEFSHMIRRRLPVVRAPARIPTSERR